MFRLTSTASWRRGTGVALLATLAGCTSEVPSYIPDAETGSTHAVITVERSDDPQSQVGHADALARFASVPAYSDAPKALSVTGVTLDLPAIDECLSASVLDDGSAAPLASLGPVEFLEAGHVQIVADGSRTPLSPHAFPSVSDFASGVVYATRDRAEEPLPAGVEYQIAVDGSDWVPRFEIAGDAPHALGQVTVSGVPLDEIGDLDAAEPIDVTWEVGEIGDIVYVEVFTQDEGVVCAFRDEEGAGTVPADAVTNDGPARLSVHRARISDFESPGIATGELRFDFELTTSVELVN